MGALADCGHWFDANYCQRTNCEGFADADPRVIGVGAAEIRVRLCKMCARDMDDEVERQQERQQEARQ